MPDAQMSRRLVLGGGLGVAVAPVVGVGGGSARVADSRGPLRVGVLLDTSGPAAVHGKRQLLGVRYQADVINAAGGADGDAGVRLFVRDTQGSVDVTLAHTKTLLDTDRVDALIGTSMPPTALVMMEAAQQAGVPAVVPTTVSPPEQPYVFCSAATSQQTTRHTMRSLAQASLRRAGLLILDTLVTPQRMKIFFQEAAAHGIELIAVEQFTLSATTLVTPLSALTAAAAQAILVAGPPPFNAMAAREVRALRWPGRLYCSASAGYPGFLEMAGPAAEGVRVVAPWLLLAERVPDSRPNSWAIREFVAGFTPRHGPIGTFAGYAADAVTMLHHAYVGHRDRRRARDTLAHMAYTGVTGVYRMTPGNHAGLDDNAITILVVRNGIWAIEDGKP